MSRTTSQVIEHRGRGFLRSDISEFLKSGQTQAGGTASPIKAPTKKERVVATTTRRTATGILDKIPLVGKPSVADDPIQSVSAGFADITDEQFEKLVQVFQARGEEIRQIRRQPRRRQTALA